MKSKYYKLFSFKKIRVEVSLGWLIVLGLLLLPALLSLPFGGWLSFSLSSFSLPLFILGIEVSILVHELGHAVAGLKVGASVQKIQIHLLGGFTHFNFIPPTLWKGMLIYIAGPLSNFILGGLLFLLALFGGPGFSGLLGGLATINLFLGVFNALPAFPLDGGRFIYALLLWLTYRKKVAAGVTLLSGLATVALTLVWFATRLGPDTLGLIFYLIMVFAVGETIFLILTNSIALYTQAGAVAHFYPDYTEQVKIIRREHSEAEQAHNSDRLYRQALSEWKEQNLVRALGTLTQALELDPDNQSYRFLRAKTLYRLHELGLALAEFDSLVKANPKNPDYFSGRGLIYLCLGRVHEARGDLDYALTLNPSHSMSLELRSKLQGAPVMAQG